MTALRLIYALSIYLVMMDVMYRKPSRPFFLLLCWSTCLWTAVYDPTSASWAERYASVCFWMLMVLRLLAVAECLCIVSRGLSHSRTYLFGTSGMAIAWVIFAWNLRGTTIERLVQSRSFIMVGTWCFLLVPMLVLWAEDVSRNMRHGWMLLAMLGNNAIVSILMMVWAPLNYPQWKYMNIQSYVLAIGCCLMWLLSPRQLGCHFAAPEPTVGD